MYWIIAIGAAIITVAAFVGSSLSNALFEVFSKKPDTQNELKNDIRVMSTEIKAIGVIEILGLAVALAIICIIFWSICTKINKKIQREEPTVVFQTLESGPQQQKRVEQSSEQQQAETV